MKAVIGGTTRDSLNIRDLRELEVAVPPLDEQHRIVARLNELIAEGDSVRQRLARVRSIVERFRQSVLAAACSGRLTEDWRENQLTEDGWREMKLADLLAEPLANGRSVVDAAVGFPVLRLTCLKNGGIDLNERKIGAWTAEAAKQFSVFKDDFLVSRGNGSLTHVGRGGLVEDEPDGVAYPDTLIRMRLRKDMIEPTFLREVWRARPLRAQIESAAHTSAGIWKISQKDIGGFVLPVPPLGEQHAIVRRVGALLKLADTIEKQLTAATALAERLTQSILAKAFRGELVPTEAELARKENRDYESASALLERIRAANAEGNGGLPKSAGRPEEAKP
jgi:type I restriction enzyme S subunit